MHMLYLTHTMRTKTIKKLTATDPIILPFCVVMLIGRLNTMPMVWSITLQWEHVEDLFDFF